ncbi:RNA pyrophosphohydrolase [Persicirhabdus sediminis]|uniref:RNA pyrophosphohydrolase n=1 Tax=Persicirhabdus sediminis TaxID=454144 RepID=A0A8J7MC15_9BACT|nr:RNA pyrophosphohydrolase [Persicirhabdus sediminis]MBK1789823.1 RNA pyrophosphohydrolase [Persicirhabdus sediminis]
MPHYRPNVAALIMNRKGKLLICERFGNAGAWQFPQGGVDHGETFLTALVREIKEEIGLPKSSYKVKDLKMGYRYHYSKPVIKKGVLYDGQEQVYFLCKLKKSNQVEIDVNQSPPEFSDYKWIKPKDFPIKSLPEFKRKVYRQVLWDFFKVRVF